MRSHRSSRRLFRLQLSTSRFRALRMLAAGTLTGAFSSPYIARADSATAPDNTTNTANDTSSRLPQNALRSEDGQGPRVSILQPSYSDLVRGDTGVVIAVEAHGAPTKSVQLFVDGVSASDGGAIPFENLPSAHFNWKTGQFKDGKHQLSVRVTDANGFIGQADTQVYINNNRTPDTTAPKLQWMNVHSGDLLHGQADLQLKASDTFGVKYIVITINSISSPDRMPPLRASLINREPYVYSLDTTRLPDGVYVLKARGTDVLQNEGETHQVTFGVSNNGLNPTVVERLDEVLKKQTDSGDASNSADSISRRRLGANKIESSAGTMVAQTHHDARVAPARTFPKAAPLFPVPGKATVATRTRTKAPISVPVIKKSVAQPKRVAAAITSSQSVEAASLILPYPSLTTAPVKTSAEPTLNATTATTATNATIKAESEVPLRVSAPFAGAHADTLLSEAASESSTRFAAMPKPTADFSTLAKPSVATMTAATTTLIEARITAASTSATETSNGSILSDATPRDLTATRLASAVVPASPHLVSSTIEAAVPVETTAAQAEPETTSAATVKPLLTPELRKTREVPGVRPTRPMSPAQLRKARSLPGVLPTQAQAAKVETVQSAALNLKPMPLSAETLRIRRNVVSPVPKFGVVESHPVSRPQRSATPRSEPQRLAMLPRFENKARPQMATRSVAVAAPGTFATDRNATVSAVELAQAQIRMTASVFTPTGSWVAQSGIFAMPPRRERSVRRLISLPSNLGTPAGRSTTASRPTAPITMSPVTIAALGARGAAGTLPALHVVARGETLRTVAERYGLPIRTLASVNNLSQNAVLTAGTKLNLPRALNFRFANQDASNDIGAIMVGQSSVAPFRFLFEQQGGTIQWDAAHQRITATNGAQQVTLSIGSRQATVNDRKVMMDLAAFLLSGRTMVPIRFFEKALQAQVQWEPSTGRIYISMSNEG